MKKLLIVVSVVAFLGLVVIWIFFGFGPKPVTTGPGGGNVTFPSSGTVPVSTSTDSSQGQPVLTITGTGGAVISTLDFLHASTTGEYPIAGHFYLGYHAIGTGVDDATATADPPYLIEYLEATHYFNVELLSEPIGAVRLAAEQFLMANLGIPQSQMCQLKYTVSVPNSVNSQFAGIDLRFSFCPGATALPK